MTLHPYCAPALSRLCLLRQRWLPCAKGAVGKRRLRDWRRDAAPILRSRAKPVVSIQAKMAPLCKGGTAWQGHAGGIVRPIASNRPFLRLAARIAGQLFPALARQRRSNKPNNASPPETGTAVPTRDSRWQNSLCLDGHNRLSAGAQYGCGVTPPIPQSAFADSSLCTREPSLPGQIQPA